MPTTLTERDRNHVNTSSRHGKSFRSILLAFVFFAFLVGSAWGQLDESITWMPENLASGSPCLFIVKLHEATIVTANWQNHELKFFRTTSDSEVWYSLAGIDVAVKPGSYDLRLDVRRNGETHTLHRVISISPAPYKEIPLSVPEKFVQPDVQAQKIIAEDQAIKRRVFAESASVPLWRGDFLPPLRSAPSTDSFGTRRVFNGQLASIHRGLDYRAKPGTLVRATNSGQVVLARSLYYEGNCVVIDHGLGLMTVYMHLSKFKVKEAQQVRAGQLVGLKVEEPVALRDRIFISGFVGRASISIRQNSSCSRCRTPAH